MRRRLLSSRKRPDFWTSEYRKNLIRMIGVDYKEPLRACYPRDVVQQILWGARYLQKEPHLDREAVIQACRNYFLAP